MKQLGWVFDNAFHVSINCENLPLKKNNELWSLAPLTTPCLVSALFITQKWCKDSCLRKNDTKYWYSILKG